MPKIPTYNSQVSVSGETPAVQINTPISNQGNLLSQTGRTISNIGKTLFNAQLKFKKTEELNKAERAVVDYREGLLAIQNQALNDTDYDDMPERYDALIESLKNKVIQQNKLNNVVTADLFNKKSLQYDLMTRKEINKIHRTGIIKKAKQNLYNQIDLNKKQFFLSDNKAEEKSYLQDTLNIIDSYVDAGVIHPKTGHDLKQNLNKTFYEDKVLFDIDNDPVVALEKLKSNEYGISNRKKKRELENIAEKEIKKQQDIQQSQTKDIQQQHYDDLFFKVLDGESVYSDVVEYGKTGKISSKQAEHLIGLLKKNNKKVTDNMDVWEKLHSDLYDYNLSYDDYQEKINTALSDSTLTATTAKSFLQKKMTIEHTTFNNAIKRSNDILTEWTKTNFNLKDKTKEVINNFETVVDKENPSIDELPKIVQSVKDYYLRQYNPDIQGLKQTPNKIFSDKKFNIIDDSMKVVTPDVVYNPSSQKLEKNNKEVNSYSIYIKDKDLLVGFPSKVTDEQATVILMNNNIIPPEPSLWQKLFGKKEVPMPQKEAVNQMMFQYDNDKNIIPDKSLDIKTFPYDYDIPIISKPEHKTGGTTRQWRTNSEKAQSRQYSKSANPRLVPAEPSFYRDKARPVLQKAGLVESNEQKRAKDAISLSLAKQIEKKHNVGIDEALRFVDENYDDIIYDKFGTLTPAKAQEKLVELGMSAVLIPALAYYPIPTIKGIVKFAGLQTVKHKLFYKKAEDLLPEEASQLSKDIANTIDFIGTALIAGGMTRKNLSKGFEKATKQMVDKYTVGKRVYISPEKIKSIFQTGEKISEEELDLVKSLGLNSKQYKTAIEKGLDIEIPVEKSIHLVDRPYWAKIKKVLKIKPTDKTVNVVRANPVNRNEMSPAPEKPTPASAPEKPVPASAPEKPTPASAPEKPTPASAPEKPTPASAPEKPVPASAPEKPAPELKFTSDNIKELNLTPEQEKVARLLEQHAKLAKSIETKQKMLPEKTSKQETQKTQKEKDIFAKTISVISDTRKKIDTIQSEVEAEIENKYPDLSYDEKQKRIKKEVINRVLESDIIDDIKNQISDKSNDQYLSSEKWDVNLPKEELTDKEIKKKDIIDYIEKEFGIKIKSLKPVAQSTPKKVQGKYSIYQELIRTRNWGEIEPITHELAHHIDKQTNGDIYKGFESELKALDYDAEKQRVEEGFAEFMRYYLTDEAKAKQKAPEFYDYFTKKYLPENPEFAKKIAGLKDRIDIWQKQGAKKRIQGQINLEGELTKDPISEQIATKSLEFQKEWTDRFAYLKEVVNQIQKKTGKTLDNSKNPYVLARVMAGKANRITRSWLLDTPVDLDGKEIKGAKPLSQILAPILKDTKINWISPRKTKEITDFITYVTAKMAQVYDQKGLESGFDIKDINYFLKTNKNDKFDAVLNELTDYFNNLLDLQVKHGRISAELANIIKDLNPIYLPIKRIFFKEGLSFKKGIANIGTGVKVRKGSAHPIENPLLVIIEKTKQMIVGAQKGRLGNAIADLSEIEGIGDIIDKSNNPKHKINLSIAQIEDKLSELDLPEETQKQLTNLFSKLPDDIVAIYIPDYEYRGVENVISVFKNGKREFYEVSPELYKALDYIDMPNSTNLALKMIGGLTTMIKLGSVGLNVGFAGRNFFKDSFTAWIYSKANVNPATTIKYLFKTLLGKTSPLIEQAERGGLDITGYIGSIDSSRSDMNAILDEVLYKELGKKGIWLYVAKHPAQFVKSLIGFTEKISRVAELEKLFKLIKKRNPEMSDEDAYLEAFMGASEVTLDFIKGGTTSKKVNLVDAFYNPALLGLQRVAQAVKERPIKTIIKGLTYMTPLALWSWYANKDKQWYKNLPLGYKYSNLWIDTGKTVIRIGLPHELGTIFGALPVAFMDKMTLLKDDNKAILAVYKLIINEIANVIPEPDLLKIAIQVWRNKNYFGTPIESKGQQYKPVTERKRYNTPELYNHLSKGLNAVHINLSPLQIEHIVNASTGNFSKGVTGIPQGRMPVLSAFVLHDKEAPRRQLQDFFTDYNALRQKNAAKTLTQKEYTKYRKLKQLYNHFVDINSKMKKSKQNRGELNKLLTKTLKQYGYE